MEDHDQPSWTAFAGARRIRTGSLADVALAAKAAIDSGGDEAVMVLDDRNCERVEIDFRGTTADILSRLPHQKFAHFFNIKI